MNFYINMCKFVFSYNLELKYFILNIFNKIYVPYLSLCGTHQNHICLWHSVKLVKDLYTCHTLSILDCSGYFIVLDNFN